MLSFRRQEGAVDKSGDFGPLVYEYKSSAMIWALFFWPLAVIAGVLGVMALNAAVPKVEWAATLFLLGLALIAVPFLMPGNALLFFQRGLIQRRPLKASQPIRYEEIERMTWTATHYTSGVGVMVTGTFLAGGRTLELAVKVMNTGGALHQKLDAVRDTVASYVAAGARQQIAAGQAFTWGSGSDPSVRLGRDGIAYQRERSGSSEKLLPWTSALEFTIEGGVFRLCAAGSREPLFGLACSEPNFYPGYLVFTAMRGARG